MAGEGGREILYLSLHCHHQNDFCINMGSDESHFNVSVGSDGQSHKTVSTNHNLFEEKGETKRYRTEVLPLTNLTPYPARPNRLTRVSILLLYSLVLSLPHLANRFDEAQSPTETLLIMRLKQACTERHNSYGRGRK